MAQNCEGMQIWSYDLAVAASGELLQSNWLLSLFVLLKYELGFQIHFYEYKGYLLARMSE